MLCRRRSSLRCIGPGRRRSCTLRTAIYPAVGRLADVQTIVGTWLSLVERTLGVGEVASSNLVVPTITLFLCFEQLTAEPIADFVLHMRLSLICSLRREAYRWVAR